MFFPEFDIANSRYERKFDVGDMMLPQVHQQIRIHPAAFSPIFHPRYINNIYLDTHDFDFFFDNVSGRGSRKKARIRWYGDLNGAIDKPVLEFKIREGFLGNKRSFPLKPFTLDNNFSPEKLYAVFEASDLPRWALEVLKLLQPSLINRYLREYFLSFDGSFRITTDTELQFYRINHGNNSFSEKYFTDNVIVELKYDFNDSDAAADISSRLPFRLTKSSKYVVGIEKLFPTL